MNMQEMAKLLMTATLIDPRMGRKTDQERLAMAAAWLEILDDDLTPEFAATALKEHYKTSSEVFMPVHIQSRYKAHKSHEWNKEQARQIAESRHPSKGMPEEVRVQLRHLGLIKS